MKLKMKIKQILMIQFKLQKIKEENINEQKTIILNLMILLKLKKNEEINFEEPIEDSFNILLYVKK